MNVDAFAIATGMLGLSLLLALTRAAIGPSLPDRVVALELTSLCTIAIVLVQAIEDGSSLLLDVAMVLALVVFLGSIGFAYYLEKRPPE